jgi:hypothetical protein
MDFHSSLCALLAHIWESSALLYGERIHCHHSYSLTSLAQGYVLRGTGSFVLPRLSLDRTCTNQNEESCRGSNPICSCRCKRAFNAVELQSVAKQNMTWLWRPDPSESMKIDQKRKINHQTIEFGFKMGFYVGSKSWILDGSWC